MIDLHSLDLEDPRVYEMISKGRNLGLFQIGEPWVRGILRDIKPACFDDLIAINALLRPGSTDNGFHKQYAERKKHDDRMPDVHPEVDEKLYKILEKSYGMAIYQEDALAIISAITGWGYATSDVLFNAFRKKDHQKLASQKPAFFEASKYSLEATEAVWHLLEPFGDYSFNKAHSTAYAYTTYWTAWLKCHYPAEFFASMLTYADGKNAKEKLDKCLSLIKEAQTEGIKVLPPDLNRSDAGFTPGPRGIRFGLEGIRDLGANSVERLLAARPFKDLNDFLSRADGTCLSARSLPALLFSGALTPILQAKGSAELLQDIERLARLALEHRKKDQLGERTLLPLDYEGTLDGDYAVDWGQAAKLERQYLGVRLT